MPLYSLNPLEKRVVDELREKVVKKQAPDGIDDILAEYKLRLWRFLKMEGNNNIAEKTLRDRSEKEMDRKAAGEIILAAADRCVNGQSDVPDYLDALYFSFDPLDNQWSHQIGVVITPGIEIPQLELWIYTSLAEITQATEAQVRECITFTPQLRLGGEMFVEVIPKSEYDL